MSRVYLSVIYLFLFVFLSPAKAIYDPLSVPNNRIGVHILDTSEIFRASQLVNSNGGDWGYVTIPIRSNDRDLNKWETFFKACRQYHVIPIIRLATFPDSSNWVAPNLLDIIDFANFLNLMPWPVQNRYIVLFNEPNHSKEWGGEISPEYYVFLSKFAYDTFKQASPDFFLLTAGFDMSAPTNHTSLDALAFYRRMFAKDFNWPNYFDGFSFHAYPNPGFSASAFSLGRFGIRSYEYELNLLLRYGIHPKYIFFTETGTISQSSFYISALNSIWKDSRIVAVTPFVLYASAGDFASFSLLNPDYSQTKNYKDILNLNKISGKPYSSSSSANLSLPIPEASSPNPEQIPVRPWWRSFIDFIVR